MLQHVTTILTPKRAKTGKKLAPADKFLVISLCTTVQPTYRHSVWIFLPDFFPFCSPLLKWMFLFVFPLHRDCLDLQTRNVSFSQNYQNKDGELHQQRCKQIYSVANKNSS